MTLGLLKWFPYALKWLLLIVMWDQEHFKDMLFPKIMFRKLADTFYYFVSNFIQVYEGGICNYYSLLQRMLTNLFTLIISWTQTPGSRENNFYVIPQHLLSSWRHSTSRWRIIAFDEDTYSGEAFTFTFLWKHLGLVMIYHQYSLLFLLCIPHIALRIINQIKVVFVPFIRRVEHTSHLPQESLG